MKIESAQLKREVMFPDPRFKPLEWFTVPVGLPLACPGSTDTNSWAGIAATSC